MSVKENMIDMRLPNDLNPFLIHENWKGHICFSCYFIEPTEDDLLFPPVPSWWDENLVPAIGTPEIKEVDIHGESNFLYFVTARQFAAGGVKLFDYKVPHYLVRYLTFHLCKKETNFKTQQELMSISFNHLIFSLNDVYNHVINHSQYASVKTVNDAFDVDIENEMKMPLGQKALDVCQEFYGKGFQPLIYEDGVVKVHRSFVKMVHLVLIDTQSKKLFEGVETNIILSKYYNNN